MAQLHCRRFRQLLSFIGRTVVVDLQWQENWFFLNLILRFNCRCKFDWWLMVAVNSCWYWTCSWNVGAVLGWCSFGTAPSTWGVQIHSRPICTDSYMGNVSVFTQVDLGKRLIYSWEYWRIDFSREFNALLKADNNQEKWKKEPKQVWAACYDTRNWSSFIVD
jgi:hypothetical protein